MDITIRNETNEDSFEIRAMIKRALNRPDEARLVDTLRNSGNLLLSVLAIDNKTGKVAGYVAASPVKVTTSQTKLAGARLAPVLVDREYQGQGLGSRLIDEVCQRCDSVGLAFIMVMGNPKLYNRFGFEPSITCNITGAGDMGDSFLLRKGSGFIVPVEKTLAQSCSNFNILDHNQIYPELIEQFSQLCKSTGNIISRMSTLAALLHNNMPYNSWTGFYLYEKGELIIGPFQGPVACLRLPKDTGVCWKAYNSGESLIVGNVHEFPGHIACDPASCSEIVLPCKNQDGKIYALLDIDSHEYNAFNYQDIPGLEQLIQMIH